MARPDPFFLRRNREFDFNMQTKRQAARMQSLEPSHHILNILQICGTPEITRKDRALAAARIETAHQLIRRDEARTRFKRSIPVRRGIRPDEARTALQAVKKLCQRGQSLIGLCGIKFIDPQLWILPKAIFSRSFKLTVCAVAGQERFPFTFLHRNRSKFLSGRIFRAAKCFHLA